MRLQTELLDAKVYGPYFDKKQGRRYVTVEYNNGSKAAMTYARFLYQEHVGRLLGPQEHVDHIDEDKLNDAIDNFQLLTPAANTIKSRGAMEMVRVICVACGTEVEKVARFVRHNRKQGRSGPFCGRSCAGRFNAAKRRAVVAQSGRGTRSRA